MSEDERRTNSRREVDKGEVSMSWLRQVIDAHRQASRGGTATIKVLFDKSGAVSRVHLEETNVIS